MKIAITGGTGFVGRHLARSLSDSGHQVVLIARGLDDRDAQIRQLKNAQFIPIGTSDEDKLADAFAGCDAVAHCAGINRELNKGDYQRIHVEGTQKVVNAARKAGVKRIALMSFFRARANCGSLYHESKYQAEEVVRNSGLEYTIVKAGMVYGLGDHMLDHLSHCFHTIPLFGLVGLRDTFVAPLAVEDLIKILQEAVLTSELANKTIAVVGPERMSLRDAVMRVGRVVGKPPIAFPMPLAFHYGFAHVLEATMKIPLISIAQVRILEEGFDQPAGECDQLPDHLRPQTSFTASQIQKGLPEPKPFGSDSLRLRCKRV